MPNEIRNVFISHVHEDDDGLKKTRDLLSKHGLDIRDGSINSEKPNNAQSPDYIKNEILKPRIKWSGCLLVYITPETKNSDWVNWEIEYAQKHGKKIIGIWAHGESGCEVPDALDEYNDAIVSWDAKKIIEAIRGDIIGSENPDGTTRNSRPIERYGC